ncbi:MAG: TetR/AcrR family transcriptional regulator [Thermaurantiacus sp.]
MATRASDSRNDRSNRGRTRPGARVAEEPRTRRYDPSETRARVLEAAYQLFLVQGYSQTGTADIARAAEVSEGSIFYHFGSKGALLAELGRLHGEKMIAAMQGDDPLETLTFRVTVARCFRFCAENSAWDNIVHEGVDCPSSAKSKHHNPEAEPFFMAAREVTETWVREHLEAIERRFGPVGLATDIAASLIFATVGEALHKAFQPGVSDAEQARIQEHCIRFLTRAAGHPAMDRDAA